MNVCLAIALCLSPAIIAFAAISLSHAAPPLQSLLFAGAALATVIAVGAFETFVLCRLPASTAIKGVLLYVFALSLAEEVPKALVLFACSKKHLTAKCFCVCAFFFGLCFGCFESVAYFLRTLTRTLEMGAAPVYGALFERIFTADALHAFCAMLCGYFVLSVRQKRPRTDAMAVIWAVLLHALYDFFTMTNAAMPFSPASLLPIAVILLAAVECRARYRSLPPVTP